MLRTPHCIFTVLENQFRQQPGSLEKSNLKSPVKREHCPATPAGAPDQLCGVTRRGGAESEEAMERWRRMDRSWEVRGHSYSLQRLLVDCSHSSKGRSLRTCPPIPHAAPLSFPTLASHPNFGPEKVEVKDYVQAPLGPDFYASNVDFTSSKMALWCHIDERGRRCWPWMLPFCQLQRPLISSQDGSGSQAYSSRKPRQHCPDAIGLGRLFMKPVSLEKEDNEEQGRWNQK